MLSWSVQKKIELRLCIKWARHFLVEGVKVKVFVTASSFSFPLNPELLVAGGYFFKRWT